ncbi:MAG: gamma-glutamyltransferase [Bacteroidota bacterium]
MKRLTYQTLALITLMFIFGCKDDSEKPIYEYTKTAISNSAMVVSAHPEATRVGLEILAKGGNAVEAAIAVQFALAVTYPVAGNIGGGGFMVIRMNDGQSYALDFREKAPLAAFRDMYLDENGDADPKLSRHGHLASGVPGVVDGMVKAYEKFGGKVSWEAILNPSIQLAEGFKLTHRQARNLNNKKKEFELYNTIANALAPTVPFKGGQVLVQKDLRNTMQLIKTKGRAGFYEGEVANKIVAEMERGGGIISLQDLKKYRAQWRTPIQSTYREYGLISMPPPSSGGIALSQLLSSIEKFPMQEYDFQDLNAIHIMTEAERRVYADRATHLGDSDFYPVPIEALINKDYVNERMSNFNIKEASLSDSIAAGIIPPKESEETTHFSIVDKDGNAVAVTTTINGGYGSKVVVGNAGFLLNNEMDDLSAKPGVPNMFGLIGNEANAIAPEKRMLSSMTPTIVTKDNNLFMVVGTPGGSTIITSVFQVISNVIDHGMSLSEAVAAKRFHHQWKPDAIFVEDATFDSTKIKALEAMGHTVTGRGNIGRVDAIQVRSDGKLEGAADPRGDDHAAGFD